MTEPEGIQPEDSEVVENDDLSALEDAESDFVSDEIDDDEDSDEDEDDESESDEDDFIEWEPVPFPQEKLDKIFDSPGLAKKKGEFKALTNLFQFYWDDLNAKMAAAHQVLQADQKAQYDFRNSEDFAEVRTALAEKREEIAADEKPFEDQIENLTRAYNDRLSKLNAEKQAAVGDRIAEADKLEAETVAGIKADLLKDLGATDNAVGEMQDVAKNIRTMERHPGWTVRQRKTRRNGETYVKEVPVYTFPIPSWTKTLGKDGLSSSVTGEGSKRVVRIDFMSVDGVEITDQKKRNFTYLRNKMDLKGSVTETTTQRLLDALSEAGMKELSTTEKFSYIQNDKDGNPHEVVVLGRPTEQ